MPHLFLIPFLFLLGACVGSFLNVVVWRLPRQESLVTPPSHCPKCNTPLAWYDNIPVFGWIFLKGRCRYCKEAISPRYPIVEAITGGLFVFYYVMFFIEQRGLGCAHVKGVLYTFPQGEPILEAQRAEIEQEIRDAKRRGEEVEPLPPPYTKRQIRAEMSREMLFLMPGLVLGGLMVLLTLPGWPLQHLWAGIYRHQ